MTNLDAAQALEEFTQRYCNYWQQQTGHLPASKELFGIPSPCIEHNDQQCVYWRAQPFLPAQSLEKVEQALDIILYPAISAFYTHQYAGDMHAEFAGMPLTLLQVWSEQDFVRLQENLIGHLVNQRRLKLSPTLFLATVDNEVEVISFCNLSGEVVLEKLGHRPDRKRLAYSLADFLRQLQPIIPADGN